MGLSSGLVGSPKGLVGLSSGLVGSPKGKVVFSTRLIIPPGAKQWVNGSILGPSLVV